MNVLLEMYGEERNQADMGDMPNMAGIITTPTVLKINIKSPVASIVGVHGWMPELSVEVEMPWNICYDEYSESLCRPNTEKLGNNYLSRLRSTLEKFSLVEAVDVDSDLITQKYCEEVGLDYLLLQEGDHLKGIKDLCMKVFTHKRRLEIMPKVSFVPAENIGGLEPVVEKVEKLYAEQFDLMVKQFCDNRCVYFNHSSELLTIDACITAGVKGQNPELKDYILGKK